VLEPLMSRIGEQSRRGFTLIELLVAVVVVAVLLALAAPSFKNMILMQRLKGVTAQLVTDLQFARSEAAQRGVPVRMRFSVSSTQTCYVIFVGVGGDGGCDCKKATMCGSDSKAIRVVSALQSQLVTIDARFQNPELAFDPSTGSIMFSPSDTTQDLKDPFKISSAIDTPRTLQTQIKLSGRPAVCAPPGSTMSAPPC
jgi:prepilin-type N-terminal cleavage/methylation domain-containing protein